MCFWDPRYRTGPASDMMYPCTTRHSTIPDPVGRGAVLSYDPQYYADGEAQVIVDKTIDYISGTQYSVPEPVASGEVAFIVGNYTSITLTPREQAIYTRLVNKGYPVHLITAYNRTTTDYTQAVFVVQVRPSDQHPDFYNGLLANGKSVLLLSDASRMLAGMELPRGNLP